MSEPTDFDPIAASLRRQFAPPDLEDMLARVAEAATDAERVTVDLGDGDPLHRSAAPAPSTSRVRRVAGMVVAFAAAAGLVLLLAQEVERRPADEPRLDPAAVAQAPSAEQIAGRQLVDFLRHGATLPGDPASCSVEQPPPACEGAEDGPRLKPTPNVQLVGECGGTTGVDCAGHDLPAQRALLVRLMPSGADAIVCIEPPEADPNPRLPSDSEYKIFRRTLNGHVLYEVTPLDHPQAVDYLDP